jgi:peptidoglycan/LPS O-acetylase OafA/YrhL
LNSDRAPVHLAVFLVVIYVVYWFVVTHAVAVQKLVEGALPEQYKNTAWGWLMYPSPYMRVLEFIAGMLTAKLYLSPYMSRIERFLPLASVLSVIAIGLCMYLFISLQDKSWMLTHTVSNVLLHMRSNAFYVPLIVVILLGVSSHRSHLVKNICTNQMVLRLGEMSYSIYLMQHFAFSFNHAPSSVDYWAHGDIKRIVFSMVVSIAATLIISFGTYYLIEVPGRRAIRRALSYESISGAVVRLTSRYRAKRRTDESNG